MHVYIYILGDIPHITGGITHLRFVGCPKHGIHHLPPQTLWMIPVALSPGRGPRAQGMGAPNHSVVMDGHFSIETNPLL